MKLKAHQPVAGKLAEEDINVDDAHARFLIMNGYASPGENPPEDGREGPDYLMADQRDEDGSSAKGAAKIGDHAMPKKSDSKGDWVAYAVEHGATEDEANDMTKDELIDTYYEE